MVRRFAGPNQNFSLTDTAPNIKEPPKFFSKDIPNISTLKLSQQISFLGVGLEFIIVQFFNWKKIPSEIAVTQP